MVRTTIVMGRWTGAGRRNPRRLILAGMLSLGLAASAYADPTITPSLDVNQGDIIATQPFTLEIFVKGAKVDKIDLPNVAGLDLTGSGLNPNGGSLDFTFFLTPEKAGDYVIPAFDVKTTDGQTLHCPAIKVHAKPFQQ